MGNTLVKSQLNDVKTFLGNAVAGLEGFLNETTLSELSEGLDSDQKHNQIILSNLRKLLVYSEETMDACTIILNSEPFQKPAAEKTLYRVYHQCIEEFFSPKNDAWYEDSRAAYTGKNAIKFYKPVSTKISELVNSLESEFQRMREELEFYETDYRTKMTQSK